MIFTSCFCLSRSSEFSGSDSSSASTRWRSPKSFPCTRQFLSRMLFLRSRPFEADFSCLGVNDDVVRVKIWLRSRGASAGALGELFNPLMFVFDGGLHHLHGRHAPVGFGADHQAQVSLLSAHIAVGCRDGEFAQDSLDDRDPFDPIAFTDCNGPIGLLDRQRFNSIFEPNSWLPADFGADKRACLSTTVVDCGPASDSALAWPVPDVVAARSTSSNGNSCLLGRRCADVRSDVAVPGR